MGSSVAQKTTDTVLSQSMRQEDDRGRRPTSKRQPRGGRQKPAPCGHHRDPPPPPYKSMRTLIWCVFSFKTPPVQCSQPPASPENMAQSSDHDPLLWFAGAEPLELRRRQ